MSSLTRTRLTTEQKIQAARRRAAGWDMEALLAAYRLESERTMTKMIAEGRALMSSVAVTAVAA